MSRRRDKAAKATIRRAIYTRKSTEEGLEMEFNSLDAQREAAEAFQQSLREAMKGTVWVTGCDSWYLAPDGIPTLWPWSAKRFHEVMREPVASDFEWIDPA